MKWTHQRIAAAVVMAALAGLAGCAKQAPPVETGAVPAADARVIEHTVGPGETLARIADNYYGDPGRYTQIAADNGLADPGRIVPGSVLRLRFAREEWDHAKRRANALAAYNKGVDLLANERVGEAERQFTLALETAPELRAARYNLALVHLKRGQNDRALALLEQLTAERPDDADFLFAHGNALFQATRFDAAADRFTAALAQRPGFRRAAFGLARALQEAGAHDRAITAWRAYLELDDSSGWAATARRNLRKLQDESGG